MSSPSGSSGTGTGSTANVYTPMAQPTADFNFQNLVQPFINTGMAGAEAVGAMGSPSANSFLQAQPIVSNYLTNNPWATSGAGASGQALGYDLSTLFPQAQAGSAALSGAASGLMPDIQTLLSNANDPAYSGVIGQAQNNPYYSMAVGGAMQGAGIGGTGATGLSGAAGRVLDNSANPLYGSMTNEAMNNPFYSGTLGGATQGAQLGAAGANSLQGAGQQILNTGFDPQAALFNREQQQFMDETNAIGAMSGVGSTPYGASVADNAMMGFNTDWQNKQLGRQTQAAGAASPLFQAAPGLAATSAAMPSQAFMTQLNQSGGLLNQQNSALQSGLSSALPGYTGASNLATGSAAAPSMAQGTYLQSIIQALNARNTAGLGGAGGAGSLLGATGSGLAGADQIGQTGAAALGTFGAAPFQSVANVVNSDLSGLSSLAQLGNGAFQLPQQAINDLQSYLGLGQSASGLSGQLGQMGSNQTAAGIGGGLSGLNSLFGPSGGGGLLTGGGGLGSLLGGGGASLNFGGGGAAMGVADQLGAIAPAAAMSA